MSSMSSPSPPTADDPATTMSSPPSSSIARAASSSSIVATSTFGSHVLKIDGYTRTKGLATGIHLRSCSFRVGGHAWHLAYLPNGDSPQNVDFISFYLVLEDPPGNGAPVLAQFCIALLDRAGKPVPSHTQARPVTRFAAHATHRGFTTFIRREVLEKSRFLNLKDDSFCVRCEVDVVTGFRAEDAARAVATACIIVPPPDLSRNFGELLRSGLGVDVRFRVDGEDFAAHRCVLAARSPVFQAQLFGAMREASLAAGEQCCWVEIDDMRADVFRNLLHFIYTDDVLPTNTKPGERQEEALIMAQHLLVAADRYGVERLKLICEDVLCRHIDVGTAATTLALAEQHRCQGLKEACFQFLKRCPGSLNAVMATDGFDHLVNSCPPIIKELMSRLVGAAHSN